MNCPICGNGRIHSNQLLPLTSEHYRQGARAIAALGKPQFVPWLGVLYAVHEAVNTLRPAHRCDHCGHRWS